MTYRPHILLSFGGRFFASEQWANNLRIQLGPAASSVVSPENLQTWAEENIEDIAADVEAWFTRIESRISQAAKLDWLKLNAIGANGRYVSQEATNLFEWSNADAPSGTVTATYPQLTVAVSLLTDAARGRASRGRIYPPTGIMTLDNTTGRIADTNASDMAGSMLQLLNEIANEPGLDLSSPRVVVASELGSPGPMRDVTSVAVGNVVDTQRRRRNELVEIYQPAGPVVIS